MHLSSFDWWYWENFCVHVDEIMSSKSMKNHIITNFMIHSTYKILYTTIIKPQNQNNIHSLYFLQNEHLVYIFHQYIHHFIFELSILSRSWDLEVFRNDTFQYGVFKMQYYWFYAKIWRSFHYSTTNLQE